MNVRNFYSLAREADSSEQVENINQNSRTNTKWQQEYKSSVTNINDLCKSLELTPDQLPISLTSHQEFSLRVSQSYLQRIKKSSPNDPLLLQILPTVQEQRFAAGFTKDPVGDLQSIKSKGLLQKYKGRALLIATSRCAIHCRYCFRRHFPYSDQNPRHDSWQQSLSELANDTSIHEVILSGGDPLVLSDLELSHLAKAIESIKHIKRLRIHTRLPIIIPSRISNEFIEWISNTRLKIVIVLHINHAQEINFEVQRKLQLLSNTSCTLLNQSVLLKNINDTSKSLIELSEALFNNNILPYYLHLLDKVEGAKHFEVSKKDAQLLMRKISSELPGYMTPKLVEEIPNKVAKSLVSY